MKKLLLATIVAFISSASFAEEVTVPDGYCANGCVVLSTADLEKLQADLAAAEEIAFAKGAKSNGVTCLRDASLQFKKEFRDL